jgi:thiol-disulfide isomerase/thioredoxin
MSKKIIFLLFFTLSFKTSFAKGLTEYEHEAPKEIQDIQFYDKNNSIHSLNDYKGKVVLVNFWATWCKPCVHEMPSLSKLEEKLSGLNIEILPVSIDFKGIEVVEEFYKEHNINNLESYLDKNGDSFKNLKLYALPTTIILDKEGMEVARVLGDIDWSTDEVSDYLIKLYSN